MRLIYKISGFLLPILTIIAIFMGNINMLVVLILMFLAMLVLGKMVFIIENIVNNDQY